MSTEMEKTHDDIACVEAVAVLDAVEVAVVECSQIFREVAGGEPLDPQRAFRATAFACRFPTGRPRLCWRRQLAASCSPMTRETHSWLCLARLVHEL